MGIETIMLAVRTDAEDYEQLIDAAIDVAEPTGASVVVGVTHSDETYEAANDNFDDRVSPEDLAQRNRRVRDVIEQLDSADVWTEIRAGVGDAGETFVSIADGVDADRVFVQERARSPTGKALFGSVAQTVLLNAPCPVTFVRQ